MSNKKLVKFQPRAVFAASAERAQGAALKVQESAQNVWLAGLGALTLAEDEGGKLFKALVRRGTAVDNKNKRAFSSLVKDVESKVEVVKETMVDATSGTFGKIEAGIESGMASVLHTFGVPTRSEIQTLTKKVDALTKSVDHKAKGARRAPARKTRKPEGAAPSGTPSF